MSLTQRNLNNFAYLKLHKTCFRRIFFRFQLLKCITYFYGFSCIGVLSLMIIKSYKYYENMIGAMSVCTMYTVHTTKMYDTWDAGRVGKVSGIKVTGRVLGMP